MRELGSGILKDGWPTREAWRLTCQEQLVLPAAQAARSSYSAAGSPGKKVPLPISFEPVRRADQPSRQLALSMVSSPELRAAHMSVDRRLVWHDSQVTTQALADCRITAFPDICATNFSNR